MNWQHKRNYNPCRLWNVFLLNNSMAKADTDMASVKFITQTSNYIVFPSTSIILWCVSCISDCGTDTFYYILQSLPLLDYLSTCFHEVNLFPYWLSIMMMLLSLNYVLPIKLTCVEWKIFYLCFYGFKLNWLSKRIKYYLFYSCVYIIYYIMTEHFQKHGCTIMLEKLKDRVVLVI